jgi:DNA-binding beta-propeller fold protein YncE
MKLRVVLKFIVCFTFLSLTLIPISTSAQSADLVASDFDGSGRVDFADFLDFAENFGRSSGQDGFDSKFDLDGSNIVDFGDFLIFANNFGKFTDGSTIPQTATILVSDFFGNSVDLILEGEGVISTSLPIPLPVGAIGIDGTDRVLAVNADTLYSYQKSGNREWALGLTQVEPSSGGFSSGPGATGVAVSDDGNLAFVAERQSSAVEVIDLSTQSTISLIQLPSPPAGVFSAKTLNQVMAVTQSGWIYLIDVPSTTVVDSILVGQLTISQVAYSNGRIYAARVSSTSDPSVNPYSELVAIDHSSLTVVDSVTIGSAPDLSAQITGMSLGDDGDRIYLAAQRFVPVESDISIFAGSGTLLCIQTSNFEIEGEIEIGETASGVVVTADGTTAYVSGFASLTADIAARLFIVDLPGLQSAGQIQGFQVIFDVSITTKPRVSYTENRISISR